MQIMSNANANYVKNKYKLGKIQKKVYKVQIQIMSKRNKKYVKYKYWKNTNIRKITVHQNAIKMLRSFNKTFPQIVLELGIIVGN